MRYMLLAISIVLCSWLVAGCDAAEGPLVETTPAPTANGSYHPGGEPVALDRLGQAALSPDAPAPEPGVRHRRRMDLDQLDLAIYTATGQRWMSNEDGSGNRMFEALSLTLGKPDFLQSTQEDLNPTLLFSKFLDDAARDVCIRAVASESAADATDRKVLAKVNMDEPLTDRAAVDANLAHLLLTFHGVEAQAGDTRVNNWRWLLENTEVTSDAPLTPWVNICAALITHPDFYSF